MLAAKLRRTADKLRNLRDNLYTCPQTSLTLWMVQRAKDSPKLLPPKLNVANSLLTINLQSRSYYVTSSGKPLDIEEQTFFPSTKKAETLLKDTNLIPDYGSYALLYVIADFAIQGRITKATKYYWAGSTTFAEAAVKQMQLPMPCLDWFIRLTPLHELAADTIDELLAELQAAVDKQQQVVTVQTATEPQQPKQSPVVEPSDPPVSSDEKQPQTKPEPSDLAGSGTYIKLLSAYTNGASDTKLKAMAEVIDGNGTIEEKTEKLNNLLSLSTLSGETIGKLLGCTKQAVFKTRYWVENRKDDLAKRSESRRNRLSQNGKQYEPGVDDE